MHLWKKIRKWRKNDISRDMKIWFNFGYSKKFDHNKTMIFEKKTLNPFSISCSSNYEVII